MLKSAKAVNIFVGNIVIPTTNHSRFPAFMDTTKPTITLNHAHHRFELLTDGKLSLVAFFQPDDHTLALTHTEVDPALEGKGVGSSLVRQVLEYTEQHDQKIVPLCPFVATYIKRHPDWQRVVSTEYDVADF